MAGIAGVVETLAQGDTGYTVQRPVWHRKLFSFCCYTFPIILLRRPFSHVPLIYGPHLLLIELTLGSIHPYGTYVIGGGQAAARNR